MLFLLRQSLFEMGLFSPPLTHCAHAHTCSPCSPAHSVETRMQMQLSMTQSRMSYFENKDMQSPY